ncbi:MAG: TRAP transporter large permease subunit, partial [Chitinivibrionales bacterium]|nr:TRAP transporter large permease subunit [Chitinivibrionales bacterium]MBD3357367.1 TRAP transporter large permease subunit [Chitinivibrionales bacterium]
VATLVCAFFTTFTGASGVTILALGALLAFILVENRYPRSFSVGLLTGSGSIGLLFPPSLPIILYSVVSNLSMNVGAEYRVDIKQMFIGGLIPGALMVGTVAALGIRTAVKSDTVKTPFAPRKALKALGASAGEILLPVLILAMFFSGFTTLVETAAIAVLFTLVLEMVIHRDIKVRSLPGVVARCVPMIGGVLIILAIARGLSYFIIDAQIPMQLAEWTSTHVHSKYVFLLVLNLALLITGCFMDIFSAIMVVVPLILPIGEAFGIHPVHLGIIFLANLELGYMTPPVGINLFLSSYRFEEPLVKVYRHVLPFLIALLVTVLLITYVPWLTTGLLRVFGLE